MNLKLVSAEWTGVHEKARKDVIYAVGQVTMAPDWDPGPVCGGGIHYAEELSDYMPESTNSRRLIEVEPVGETVRIQHNKTKAQGIRVIREITRILTPEEEPDADVRWRVAYQIPTDRLDHLPTPDEEPNARVRQRVACRIPADRLDHLPTQVEEPDVEVRRWVASKIATSRVYSPCTPEEEPAADIRLCVTDRISLDKRIKK